MLVTMNRWSFVVTLPLDSLRRARARLLEMRQALEGRRALAAMDEHMLADIGVSRAEALEEIRRKPWDIGLRR